MAYPYTPIHTPGDQIHVIELQRRHRPRVAHETAVHVSGPQVPEPDHAIRRADRERRVEDLQCADEVGLGVLHPAGRGTPPASATAVVASASAAG